MFVSETIAAISTPIGEGGIAVVRLSGRDALAIADRCFQGIGQKAVKPSDAPSHTLHYGTIQAGSKTIDEVMLAVLRAPRTFTRENMVEVSCHGGLLPARMVLDTLLSAGARPADPGEFTKRAFLNGRIDLAQAEAVADVIHSRTELALLAANEQLSGRLSQKINAIRDEMMKVLAHVEAHIDFPDEDIAPDTLDKIIKRLQQAKGSMDHLLATARDGQVLRRGIRAAIIGRPNAGKSSLLNLLLGHERAIVSPTPGTTRDTIEEMADIRGIPIIFIDTAGLRDSIDLIEIEGIRRSRQSLEAAELILHVLDASEPLHPDDADLIEAYRRRSRILVKNKADLGGVLKLPDDLDRVAPVSCVTGDGLEELKSLIQEIVWEGKTSGEMFQVMINSRHQEAIRRARSGTQLAIDALMENKTLELPAMDLRIAVGAIGEVVGKTTTEDLLDSIFSQFCIGK